eukprot:CAMPEP_0203890826 /NCGR_PEP_ID=MMETSP0359-20131031/34213_1 /ASSEMBLY_ACC=CAM_ASM_000338 /TAXON_ID=268821 /ORGANISM="Scrippsiella Hangoei, Strain SHTV-5" /LENGTH=438 /DNA_ID=CAMNT_0050812525 /DNA_START=242 /DNA_END=1556 /DNA_ORIENTATION=+
MSLLSNSAPINAPKYKESGLPCGTAALIFIISDLFNIARVAGSQSAERISSNVLPRVSLHGSHSSAEGAPREPGCTDGARHGGQTGSARRAQDVLVHLSVGDPSQRGGSVGHNGSSAVPRDRAAHRAHGHVFATRASVELNTGSAEVNLANIAEPDLVGVVNLHDLHCLAAAVALAPAHVLAPTRGRHARKAGGLIFDVLQGSDALADEENMLCGEAEQEERQQRGDTDLKACNAIERNQADRGQVIGLGCCKRMNCRVRAEGHERKQEDDEAIPWCVRSAAHAHVQIPTVMVKALNALVTDLAMLGPFMGDARRTIIANARLGIPEHAGSVFGAFPVASVCEADESVQAQRKDEDQPEGPDDHRRSTVANRQPCRLYHEGKSSDRIEDCEVAADLHKAPLGGLQRRRATARPPPPGRFHGGDTDMAHASPRAIRVPT